MAAAANDFKAIAAQKRLLPDSKYRSLPLETAALSPPPKFQISKNISTCCYYTYAYDGQS